MTETTILDRPVDEPDGTERDPAADLQAGSEAPDRAALAAKAEEIRKLDEAEWTAEAVTYVESLGFAGFGLDVCARAKDVLAAGNRKTQLAGKTALQTAYNTGLRKRRDHQKAQAEAARRDRAEVRKLAAEDLGWAHGSGLTDSFKVPTGYSVDHNGVMYVPEEGFPVRVAFAPLVIIRIFVDPEGAQSVELAWRTGGRWIHRTMPKALIKSGRKLAQAHGDAGIPIIESAARQVEQWLAAIESLNEEVIPREPQARRLGWQDDTTFVSSAGTPVPLEPKYPEQAPYVAAHHVAGTLAGWQTAVKRLEAHPVMQVVLAAGFAAPLLRLLRIDSFIFDIADTSSRGKTTSARLALSPWADPGEKADGIFSWDCKPLAAEYRLNIVSGLPVVFDESQLVKDPDVVRGLIYQIPRNHGQTRGGGWPSGLPWETVVISTGERPALSFVTEQGAAARVLSLRAAPMGANTPENKTLAEETTLALTENFGTAGPAFVDRLIAEMAADGAVDRLRAKHKELAAELGGTAGGMVGRRARLVAALALADRCATSWGIVPLPKIATKMWRDLLVTYDPADNRAEQALDIVREFVGSHANALWWPRTSVPEPSGGWIGRVHRETWTSGSVQLEDVPCVVLYANRLRKELEARGVQLDAVRPAWLDAKALVLDPDDRTPFSPLRKIRGVSARVYIFAPDVIEVPRQDDGDQGGGGQ